MRAAACTKAAGWSRPSLWPLQLHSSQLLPCQAKRQQELCSSSKATATPLTMGCFHSVCLFFLTLPCTCNVPLPKPSSDLPFEELVRARLLPQAAYLSPVNIFQKDKMKRRKEQWQHAACGLWLSSRKAVLPPKPSGLGYGVAQIKKMTLGVIGNLEKGSSMKSRKEHRLWKSYTPGSDSIYETQRRWLKSLSLTFFIY